MREHLSVADAAVVGVPDHAAGEVPKAFIIARGEVAADELTSRVAGRVAPHKRIRAVQFVDQIRNRLDIRDRADRRDALLDAVDGPRGRAQISRPWIGGVRFGCRRGARSGMSNVTNPVAEEAICRKPPRFRCRLRQIPSGADDLSRLHPLRAAACTGLEGVRALTKAPPPPRPLTPRPQHRHPRLNPNLQRQPPPLRPDKNPRSDVTPEG